MAKTKTRGNAHHWGMIIDVNLYKQGEKR